MNNERPEIEDITVQLSQLSRDFSSRFPDIKTQEQLDAEIDLYRKDVLEVLAEAFEWYNYATVQKIISNLRSSYDFFDVINIE